jgi:hypothetical protein
MNHLGSPDDPDSPDEFVVTASALLQAGHPHHLALAGPAEYSAGPDGYHLAHLCWEAEYSADRDGCHLAHRCWGADYSAAPDGYRLAHLC